MNNLLLYLDDVFAQHDTGGHPESIHRITRLNSLLRETGWPDRATCPEWDEASLDQLKRVHTPEYIQQLQQWCEQAAGRIEADTVVSPGSWSAALRGAGAAIHAVGEVVSGVHARAFCAVRPPGHHAIPTGAMGFCLVNNVAIAAQAALQMGLERVLVVDWDVHHGNGTQDTFYESDQVGFFSIHRSPFYPGTGSQAETGTGSGLGWTLNAPVGADTSTKEFFDRFTRGLEDIARRVKPQLILLSAGFDAHRLDPVGSLCLEDEDFGPLTKIVRDAAGSYCDGKVVSLLEGGYHLEHMPRSVLQHLTALE